MSDVNLDSYSPIHSLSLSSYTNQSNDVVTADWIDELNCTGDFGAYLLTYGTYGSFARSVNSVDIGGAVGNAYWRILGNAGTFQIGSVPTGWSCSIHGTLASFIDHGDFDGDLAARNIGSLQVDGNLDNAAILTGTDFGTGGTLASGTGIFSSGILASLTVNGSVINSIIAAGLKPAGTDLIPPAATLLPRSAIQSIKIAGTVDTTTLFLAVQLPKFANIGGSEIPTSGDPNFAG
jgi:hypothetical protein